jgi:hypothetical protein
MPSFHKFAPQAYGSADPTRRLHDQSGVHNYLSMSQVTGSRPEPLLKEKCTCTLLVSDMRSDSPKAAELKARAHMTVLGIDLNNQTALVNRRTQVQIRNSAPRVHI